MSNLKKGMLLGGLLGAGLTWLSTTKKGKQTRDMMIDHAADAYSQLMEEITKSKQWKQLSKSEYVTQVKKFVDTYAVKTGLSAATKATVEKLVIGQWNRFQKEVKKKK